jgi:hypothetical protein
VTLQVRWVSTGGTVDWVARRLSPLLDDSATGETFVEQLHSVRPRLSDGASVVGYLYAWFLSVRAGFARVGRFRHGHNPEPPSTGRVPARPNLPGDQHRRQSGVSGPEYVHAFSLHKCNERIESTTTNIYVINTYIRSLGAST